MHLEVWNVKIHDIYQAVYGMKHPSDELEEIVSSKRGWTDMPTTLYTIRYLWVCWKSIIIQPKCLYKQKEIINAIDGVYVGVADCQRWCCSRWKNSKIHQIRQNFVLQHFDHLVRWMAGDQWRSVAIYPKARNEEKIRDTTRYGRSGSTELIRLESWCVANSKTMEKAGHFYIKWYLWNMDGGKSMVTTMTLEQNYGKYGWKKEKLSADKMVGSIQRVFWEQLQILDLNMRYTTLLWKSASYWYEESNLDIDAVEADGYEFWHGSSTAYYLFMKKALNVCFEIRNINEHYMMLL